MEFSEESQIMPTLSDDHLDPSELVQQALSVICADPLPYLATVEGDQPRLRPIAPVKTDGFTVYIANLRSYSKTAEIESNPRVEICYLDGHNDQVRITGVAEIVTDKAIKAEIWDSNPHIRNGSSGVSGGWMAQSKPNSWCDMQLWQESSVSGPLGQVPAAKRVAAKARL